MRKSLVVVDDFYADLDAVREHAFARRWYAPYVETGPRPLWLATRHTAPEDCPFKSSAALVERLEELTGDLVDLDDWKAVYPTDGNGRAVVPRAGRPAGTLWNCAFHFKPEWNHQRLGEGVHNHVTDDWNGVGQDGWVGLVYLDPRAPLEGGLKTFRNVDPAHDLDWMTPAENWELVDSLGNVPNRLILHRGDRPHSGSAGWGRVMQEGRLYQTFFFKVLPARHPASLGLPLGGSA